MQILEEQCRLWSELASALEQAQVALLAGDLASFEQHTVEQSEHCRALQSLSSKVVSKCEPEGDGRAASLADEVEKLRSRVRHLNRVHAALLRRATRSALILQNLMVMGETLYSVPALSSTPPGNSGPRGG
jgi:hypothetical protein